MIMEGLLLKLINSNEEKITELYEIICRIIGINDPEKIGQEVVCEKFTVKALVLKVNRLIGPNLINSLKDKISSERQKDFPSFWRDNLLLEILRMGKENVNVSTKIMLNFILKIE